MTQEEYHQIIELALSLLHERVQSCEHAAEDAADRLDMPTEEAKEAIEQAFYSH